MNKRENVSTAKQLRGLVDTFARDVKLARSVQSPNEEDDLAVKAAIVGFSYHAPTHAWSWSHFQQLNQRFTRDFHEQSLAEYGEHRDNLKLFFALAFGYLLGLFEQGALSNEEFFVAEAQIAGIAMFDLQRLTAESI